MRESSGATFIFSKATEASKPEALTTNLDRLEREHHREKDPDEPTPAAMVALDRGSGRAKYFLMMWTS
jgi:hypothetical protein